MKKKILALAVVFALLFTITGMGFADTNTCDDGCCSSVCEEYGRGMPCVRPNCNGIMFRVSIRCHCGVPIIVWRCGTCGSVW